MNFRFLICVALSLISVSAFAQKTKTVVVYDSPDHSEWHTEKVVESNYAPYEFCYDLNNVDTTWCDDIRHYNDSVNNAHAERWKQKYQKEREWREQRLRELEEQREQRLKRLEEQRKRR